MWNLKQWLRNVVPAPLARFDHLVQAVQNNQVETNHQLHSMENQLLSMERQILELKTDNDQRAKTNMHILTSLIASSIKPLSPNLSEPRVIVSIASYAKRLPFVSHMLDSLRAQTYRPDAIVLWLPVCDCTQFYSSLSDDLLRSVAELNVEIRWVADDLKPHNKYFYAMQQYPNSIIITLDDDMCYDPRLIECLLSSHARFPQAVISMRTHIMGFDKSSVILPYSEWEQCQNRIVDTPSPRLFATGMGGVLYPPKSIADVAFDCPAIKETCLLSDDLWLKIMEALSRTPIVQPSDAVLPLKHVPGTQQEGLYHRNQKQGENDQNLKAILERLAAQGHNVSDLIAWMQSA